MPTDTITVKTTAPATKSETWHYYTEAEHVINWNFAGEGWHCPKATNDLREGGEFEIVMAEKTGTMKMELEGTYTKIEPETHIEYTLENGRHVKVDFTDADGGTEVKVTFDPAEKMDPDDQRKHWQAIMDNFRKYVGSVEA
ncbi:MAG: SRPBCC domain-containing protein [Lewinella sp.]